MEFYLLSAQEMGRSASANSSDCLEFQELCEALKRNDSSVTRVHCTATSQELPAGYGYRLSAALAGNTIVTEIDLNLVHFLSPAEYKAQTAKAATPLLQWIEQSASLTAVKLSCERRRRSRIGGIQPSEVLLVQRIAHSMAQNPHDIRSLEWHLRYPGLLPSLTNYLVNDNGRKQVQSLALSICRDNAPTDLEEAARAVGALASLQRFTLCGSHPTVFLQHLQYHPTLTELSVDVMSIFRTNEATHVTKLSLLADALRTIKQLKHVTLKYLSLDDAHGWKVIVAGLQANPEIVRLHLDRCAFSFEPSVRFLRTMRSNRSSQHIRDLRLEHCQFRWSRERQWRINVPLPIARMLRHSLLQHLTLDAASMNQGLLFVAKALAKSASVVQLRSLRLEGFHLCLLHFLSRYLKATVHLCRLTFSCRIDVHLAHNRLMHVPALFLHGVRRSGSLRHVEIKHPGWPDARLSDQAQRLFASFMLRNQQVPQMLVGISPVAADNDECNTAAETSHTAVPVPSTVQNASSTALFSTLCVVSNPALLMSPQLILAGLSAAPCKALGSSRSSKRARIVESPSTEAPDDE